MKQVSLYLQIGGIAIGVIGAILLVAKSPVLVGLEVLGAALYFVARYLIK